jgi:nicotinate-nucleotide adenylyltransferase
MTIRTPAPISRQAARPPLAVAGQRIGLLGGSFNPAHQAHVLISRQARARLGLDRVWWLVSPGNPLKSHRDLELLASRLAQARRLAGGAGITVTGLEAGLASAYTASTLSYLLARHPGVRFVWLMGADNLAQVHRWRDWQSLFRRVPIAVVDRPSWHLKSLASPAARRFSSRRFPGSRAREIVQARLPAWTMLSGPLRPQSSSAIRATRRPG